MVEGLILIEKGENPLDLNNHKKGFYNSYPRFGLTRKCTCYRLTNRNTL